jgi:aspartyl-tRNA(Asn)/glutamyl-tRNA(Gln) amidotransferase subunit A
VKTRADFALPNMTNLRDALVGYADWLHYGHGERSDAWVARLDVNTPELDALRSARTPQAQPYVPHVTEVAPPPPGLARRAHAMPADASDALARAKRAEDLHAFTWLAGDVSQHSRGALAGVPIAVKDLMRVAGAPLTGGTRALDGDVAHDDAEVVARLRRAGAVVIGLTNLHELAYGITSDNPRFGRVVNPASRDRIPGGSSGGSAAAVAAGIVAAALGTDTAGSIRIPAACCGIVGFKPSYDALPRDGVLDLAPSLDHVGPMTRDVEGAAASFAAMHDDADVPAWARDDLAGVTIARLRGFFDEPLDRDVRAAMDSAVAALAGDGARFVDREIAGVELAPAIQFNTIAPEATASDFEHLVARGDRLGDDVRVRLEIGMFLPAAWYVKAQRLRNVFVRALEAAFEDADLLLCPTLRIPAPRVGEGRVDIDGRAYPLHTAITQLTMPFNLSGLPAISLPWSRSRDGVPISLQLVAPRGLDWHVLAAAQRLQALAPWRMEGSRS